MIIMIVRIFNNFLIRCIFSWGKYHLQDFRNDAEKNCLKYANIHTNMMFRLIEKQNTFLLLNYL